MTKREICEELWNIANAVSFERGLVRGEADVHHAIDRATDALDYVRHALRMLLLNIAVPETEEEKEAALNERRRAVFGNIAATGKKEPEKEEKREAEEPETEMGDKAWYEICPWRRPGKNNIGLECSPLLCSQCVRKPEPQKTSYPGGEKIVDPTGKNPTFYKCPFCSAFTITQNGTTCITGDPNGKCSQCGRVFMLLGERKEGE